MTRAIVNDNSSPLLVSTPRDTRAVVIIGAAGPPGADGDALGADKYYEHTQASPSAVWTVNHGLDKYPAVTILTSAGDEVEGEVAHLSTNQLTITFTAAFAGRAYCN